MNPQTPPSPMDRVRRIAHWMRGLALVGGVALFVLTIAAWSSQEWVATVARELGLGQTPVSVTPGVRIAGALVALVPVGVGLFALLQVWHLFGDYARGAIF